MTITTNISDNNSSEPLAVLQGGTGLSSFTSGNLIYCTSSNVLAALANGAINNVLVAGPAWSGTSSPILGGSGSTSISAAVCTGYIVTSGSLVTCTLPTTFAVGAQILIQGQGAGGWTLKAGTSTTIQYGTQSTSSGGALSSSNQYDNCSVIGIVANTTWAVFSSLSSGLVVT
jgi:hypothetical protein